MLRIIYLFLLLVFVISLGLYFINANAAESAPLETKAHHCDAYENLVDYSLCMLKSPNTNVN